MKKKFALLLATTALLLVSATNVFAENIVIEGEEQTGKEYPTTTKIYYDWDLELDKEVKKELTVHLIPKTERFRVSEDWYDVGNQVAIYYIGFGNLCTEPDYSDGDYTFNGGSCAIPNGWVDSLQYEPNKYYSFEDSSEIMNFQFGDFDYGFFPIVFSEKTGSEYDWILEDLDPYIFQFADVPVLKPDEPVASDSNATNSNASRPSGSGSSSSGSRKVATNSQNINGTWIQDSIGWWFKKSDGSYPNNEWVLVKDKWYHFDGNGYMQVGWLNLNGVKYYLNPSGEMVSNDWSFQDGKWYYFDTSGAMQMNSWVKWKDNWYYLTTDGSMAINMATPDGYHVNENGVWIN